MQWTEDMDQISGFSSGYEEHCRNLTRACVLWLVEHRSSLVFQDDGSFRFGATDDEAEAAYGRMCDHIDNATGNQSSGAQIGAAASHGAFIFAKGWDAYAESMRQRKRARES